MRCETKSDSLSLYETANFFMIRTPLLSQNCYRNIFDRGLTEDDMTKMLMDQFNDNSIKEAILVASSSLYEALCKLNNKQECQKREQIINSLLKYYIRMTTRTTPFGLFSGVTLGEFGKKTEAKFMDKQHHKKRARPDMEWLYTIMRKVENDESILKELYVTSNDLCTINGSRLEVPYISNYGELYKDTSSKNISASVRYTSQVEFVVNMSKKSIKYKDLLSLLKSNNPMKDKNKIEAFLRQLLNNEYIITEIRPPLTDTEPFQYVLSILRNIDAANDLYIELLKIKNLIDEYNMTPVGEGIGLYNKIINKMKNLSKCNNYLQVDLRLKEEKVLLNENIKKEIEKAAEVLLRLSPKKSEPYYISQFKNDFIESYGTNREIPIIELLDDDKGIGSPATYKMPISNRVETIPQEEPEDLKYQKYLIGKVLQSFLRREDEIVLNDGDINIMGAENPSEFKIDEIPMSLEMNVLISAKSQEDIDKDNYMMFIGPNFGSTYAGKTFGRFIDILPNEIRNKLKNLNDVMEDMVEDDVVFAEIVELPNSGRVSNVTVNWNPRNYEVAISTNHNNNKNKISITDLYIGIDHNDKFYIKSKNLNKKVIITSGHMLNIESGSNIYRFLREISEENTRDIITRLFKNGLEKFSYVPRIRYGKVVLSPEKWKVSNDILHEDISLINKDKFYEVINIWKENWNVPKFVYLTDADNRLLLNLENKLHLDELFNCLKNGKSQELIITETERGFENLWAEGSNGKYFTEIVVPILRNQQSMNILSNIYTNNESAVTSETVYYTKSNFAEKMNVLSNDDNLRVLFPGDDWLYLKLYGSYKRIDEFIGYEIKPFCEELISNNDIDNYFFIRYADPDKHIRLRLRNKNKNSPISFMMKLSKWLHHLKDEGLLTRACIDTYSREVERYGGPELMELAEDVFYKDSVFVSNIIFLLRSGQLTMDVESIAISSIINMMEELGINYEPQKHLFIKHFDKNKYREVFKKNRNKYLKMGSSDN